MTVDILGLEVPMIYNAALTITIYIWGFVSLLIIFMIRTRKVYEFIGEPPEENDT